MGNLCSRRFRPYRSQKEIDDDLAWLKNVDVTCAVNVDRVITSAVRMLMSCKPEEDEQASSSIAYLKTPAVRKQLQERIDEFGLVRATVEIKAMLGVAFMEWKATDRDGKGWELNFWPCSQCACISCLPIKADSQ